MGGVDTDEPQAGLMMFRQNFRKKGSCERSTTLEKLMGQDVHEHKTLPVVQGRGSVAKVAIA
jgi:hypothetical protein